MLATLWGYAPVLLVLIGSLLALVGGVLLLCGY